MPETFLVTIPGDAPISPVDRLTLKDAIGWAVRGTLVQRVDVAVDHLGMPVTDLHEKEATA